MVRNELAGNKVVTFGRILGKTKPPNQSLEPTWPAQSQYRAELNTRAGQAAQLEAVRCHYATIIVKHYNPKNDYKIWERVTMECPIDGTEFETHTVHSVNIEECVQCRGLWFEKGELHKVKDMSEPDLNWLDFDLWSDQESFVADWSSLKCPDCRKNMATITYAGTGVTVDYCAEGHGIWLDKGEFQAIIESLEKEVVSKSASDYVTASLEEAKEIITGDEGFISEWKDFLTVTRLLQYRVLIENPKVAELLSALQSMSPFK